MQAKNIVSRPNGFIRVRESTPSRNVSAVFELEPIGIPHKFETAYQNWRDETMFSSFIEDKLESVYFEQIVEMGSRVLPYLFRKLRSEPSFIFLAAEKILGFCPIEGREFDDMAGLVDAWLEWAERGNFGPQEVQ